MKLISISAKNFMSFRDLDYCIPERGLYFVGGRIVDSVTSNSNGAGKSSLFEAIAWGLYGETLRNTGDVGSVVNRRVKSGCYVDIKFWDDSGSVYQITRYRADKQHQNSLYLVKNSSPITGADKVATQTQIDQAVGMNWLVFSTAVLFGSQAQRFAEARDAEKKAVFDEILMLHRYQEAQKAVKADLKAAAERVAACSASVATYSEALQSIARELVAIDRSEEALETEKGIAVADRQKLLDAAEQHRVATTAFTETAAQLRREEQDLEAVIKEINDLVVQIETEKSLDLSGHEQQAAGLIAEVNLELREIDKQKAAREKMSALGASAVCPTCHRAVDAANIAAVIASYDVGIKTLSQSVSDNRTRVNEIIGVVTAIKHSYDERSREASSQRLIAEKEKSAVRDHAAAADHSAHTQESAAAMLVQRAENMLVSYQQRKSMLEASRQRQHDSQKRYTDMIHSAENERAVAAETGRYLEFWMEAFGNRGIKSFVLDEIMPALSAKANYYASVLMDGNVQISFSTETTIKSGETRDKFDIQITVDGELSDYRNFSSGERRRIDVAILLALHNLVAHRAGATCNVAVFDEVFDSLDVTGIERTINLLNDESQSRVTYVISHSQEFADYFDNVLMIQKEKGVSSIV